MIKDTAIVLFREKEIRRTWHNEEWWFSVVDICAALTESADSGAYWRKLKQRLTQEGSEVVTICHGLKLPASDGRKYITDCANTESVLRLIQSIPSPTAEISKATFGMTPAEYKHHKKLPTKSKANLRDHMTDLELIFTMLGESVTTEISKNEKPVEMSKNKNVARRGGSVAGKARKETEKELRKSVISQENHLKFLVDEINDGEGEN